MNSRQHLLPFMAVALGMIAQGPAVHAFETTIPERTEVHVALDEDLKSGVCAKGDEVPFKVSRDVYGPGHVLLIEEGTPAYGTVIESRRRGILGKPGRLNFSCDYILMPDGAHISLRSPTSNSESGQSNDTGAIAAAVLVTPWAMFINGKDIEIKKGTEFTMLISETQKIDSPVDSSAQTSTGGDTSGGGGSAKSLFTLKDGSQVVGSLVSFDGTTYVIATSSGNKKVRASSVKSVYSIVGEGAPNPTDAYAPPPGK